MTTITMKSFLVALFSCIFLLPASAGVKEDVWKLSKEKSKLNREFSSLFRKNKLGDKEYDELSSKAFGAAMAFGKARKDHPDLKELNKANDAAQSKMMKTMMAKDKDKEAITAARNGYVEAQQALQAGAVKIPEIVALQKKAMEANEAVQAKKIAMISATPEGAELAKKMKYLDAEIAELQKKL